MRIADSPNRMAGQTGGITILVALMMLVFITITAVGMSRNSFREVVISGTSRQGAMARNVADSGIEWAIYWMDSKNSVSPADAALKLKDLKAELLKQSTLSGLAWDVMSKTPATPAQYVPGALKAVSLATITTSAGTKMDQSFTAGVTRMGKLPITDISQGNGSGAFSPAAGNDSSQAPDLWAVRSDGQVTVGAVTFTQGKEVWISTPVQ